MNQKQLDYFIRIAELGSFRRASEALRIAQPALTRQIQRLEQDLGVQLFFRGGRGIILTNAGELLLERAQFIQRQTEQAMADVRSEGSVPRGSVSLGAPGSIANVLFKPLVETYLRLYPGVRLRLYDGVAHLRDQLLSGVLDLAILPTGRVLTEAGIGSVTLVREPVYLAGPPGEFAFGSNCMLADVVRLPLVAAGGASSMTARLEASALSVGQELEFRVETENLPVLKELIRAGIGYSVLPYCAVCGDDERGYLSLCRVEDCSLDRVLGWRTDRPLTPAVRAMVTLIREQVEKLKQQGAFGRCD